MRFLTIGLLLQVAAHAGAVQAGAAQPRQVVPVLAFPDPALDDTAAYRGYQTRFYRDSKGNTVQIYVDGSSGRVVTLWADAANESVGFTVRDAAGRPARLAWGADAATVSDSGAFRTIEYRLTTESPRVVLGWFVLGSMRVERDFQYERRHLQPFAAPPFRVREMAELVANVARLAPAERRRHLALLGARDLAELSARLEPTLRAGSDSTAVLVTQPSLDGKNRLALELRVDPREATATRVGRTVAVRSRGGGPVTLTVRVTTDAAPLTPLTREQIFNRDFLDFLARARAAHDSVRPGAADSAAVVRYRWLEREVRGVELLSSEEKFMAGLPNYATYFGRDMMMTALMMQSVWRPEMYEHVVASVLRKLGPGGAVSHEEALAGQAIREGAAEYNALRAEHRRQAARGQRARADSALARARAVLGDLQATRENYHMLDDEFQLPVVAARYLADPSVPAERKRAFLMDTTRGVPRLTLLVRELALVAELAAPYVREPVASNLIAFPRRDSTRWASASWRDSGAGYANGRFAMDINAIWVPHALQSIAEILAALRALGVPDSLAVSASEQASTPLARYVRDPESLRRAVATWGDAWRHFLVALPPDEVAARVRAKLAWMPAEERQYWQGVLGPAVRDSLRFLALALDSAARPIPVVNTDPATALFLGDAPWVAAGVSDSARRARVLLDAVPVVTPYPVGLLIEGLGPVVANDAYAPPRVWNAFRDDHYHGPRVVWGREVNLFVLGLVRRLADATDAAGRPRDPALAPYVAQLRAALERTTDAVDRSGMKHAELWSYRIDGGRLHPERYGTGSDVQLWSTTELVVQYALSRLGR